MTTPLPQDDPNSNRMPPIETLMAPPDLHAPMPTPPPAHHGAPAHANKHNGSKAAPPSAAQDASEAQRLEDLRSLSAEMLDLQDVLNKVIAGDTTLAVYATYITDTTTRVNTLVQSISTEGSRLQDSDALKHIVNAWQKITYIAEVRDPATATDAQQQLHDLNLVNTLIDKIVYLCGYLTIPSRLTEWLDETRPGYYIPFHEVFQDEIPNAEDRARLLKYLAWSPVEVKNGYVDLDAGLVYKYSRRRLDRWMSVFAMLLGFVIASLIVAGACYIALPGWNLQPANSGLLLSGWGALLLGVGVHIGIGNIKDTRKKGLPALFAPGDIFFIINARLTQILLKLFIALIGLFGLVLTNGIAQFSLFSAFLVGYSLDSFAEMFGSSLESQSSSQLNTLQKQLGVTQE